MKTKINKTNAARLLDKAKVAYELIPYEVDENDLSAPHVAASLGEDINCVFKTLVLHGDKTGHFVCVIPGEHEVDRGPQAGRQGERQQEVRPYPRQGAASPHRIYPWRLFAHWDEEAFPYLHPPHVPGLSLHLRQCRDAWLAAENRSARLDSGGKCRSLRVICWITGQNV